MTQREKLIDLLETIVLPRKEIYSVAEIADFMIDFGVVVLPCKVDAPLYYIGRRLKHGELSNEYSICEGKAEAIEFDSDGWVVFDEHGTYFSQNAANVPYFTREEAETALKNMEGEK